MGRMAQVGQVNPLQQVQHQQQQQQQQPIQQIQQATQQARQVPQLQQQQAQQVAQGQQVVAQGTQLQQLQQLQAGQAQGQVAGQQVQVQQQQQQQAIQQQGRRAVDEGYAGTGNDTMNGTVTENPNQVNKNESDRRNEAPQLPIRQFVPVSSSMYNDMQRCIRIVSFNVLSGNSSMKNRERKLNPSSMVTRTKYWSWRQRGPLLLREIVQYKPDIICLQEVDQFEYFESGLAPRGFAGIYERRLPPEDSNEPYWSDGLAIFWRSDRFELVGRSVYTLGDSRLVSNIAVLARLRLRNNIASKDSNRLSAEIDVWNTHLIGGTLLKSERRRLKQAEVLFNCIARASAKEKLEEKSMVNVTNVHQLNKSSETDKGKEIRDSEKDQGNEDDENLNSNTSNSNGNANANANSKSKENDLASLKAAFFAKMQTAISEKKPVDFSKPAQETQQQSGVQQGKVIGQKTTSSELHRATIVCCDIAGHCDTSINFRNETVPPFCYTYLTANSLTTRNQSKYALCLSDLTHCEQQKHHNWTLQSAYALGFASEPPLTYYTRFWPVESCVINLNGSIKERLSSKEFLKQYFKDEYDPNYGKKDKSASGTTATARTKDDENSKNDSTTETSNDNKKSDNNENVDKEKEELSQYKPLIVTKTSDFVLYSPQHFRVLYLLDTITKRWIEDHDTQCLPNKDYPSDHILIGVDLELAHISGSHLNQWQQPTMNVSAAVLKEHEELRSQQQEQNDFFFGPSKVPSSASSQRMSSRGGTSGGPGGGGGGGGSHRSYYRGSRRGGGGGQHFSQRGGRGVGPSGLTHQANNRNHGQGQGRGQGSQMMNGNFGQAQQIQGQGMSGNSDISGMARMGMTGMGPMNNMRSGMRGNMRGGMRGNINNMVGMGQMGRGGHVNNGFQGGFNQNNEFSNRGSYRGRGRGRGRFNPRRGRGRRMRGGYRGGRGGHGRYNNNHGNNHNNNNQNSGNSQMYAQQQQGMQNMSNMQNVQNMQGLQGMQQRQGMPHGMAQQRNEFGMQGQRGQQPHMQQMQQIQQMQMQQQARQQQMQQMQQPQRQQQQHRQQVQRMPQQQHGGQQQGLQQIQQMIGGMQANPMLQQMLQSRQNQNLNLVNQNRGLQQGGQFQSGGGQMPAQQAQMRQIVQGSHMSKMQ